MEQLVVRLGSDVSDPIHWLVWSSTEREIIASGELSESNELSSLAERAGSRPIIALVPTSDVYLTWLDLPAKAARKAMSAIPFMLEESLSGDITDQFFATGMRRGNQLAVAAVERQKMQQWLGQIESAGLFCDKMLPDIHALPQSGDNWSLICLGEQALVRQDDWLGLQGDAGWVIPSLEFHAKSLESPLVIDNYSDRSLEHMANITAEQQPLDVSMQVLAEGAQKSAFNLLQGDFTVKRKSTGRWQQWRLAAGLAALALLTTLVDKGIEINQLNSQKAVLDDEIRAEVKRAFPNIVSYRNVRSRVQRELSAMGDTGGDQSVLMMMSQLSEAFDSSDVKPQTLRYDRSRAELRLQAEASNFDKLEQFIRLAQEKGFTVEQGAINNRDNAVVGSLLIKG